MDQDEKCFACGKRLSKNKLGQHLADTRDGQTNLPVGSDCYKKIISAGELGYQPPKGGPRLYWIKG